MYKCICSMCKKGFDSTLQNVKICNECKNRPCEVCKKPFKHIWPYDQHCCSKTCRQIWIQYPDHIAEANAKRKATVEATYGVSNISQVSSVAEKISFARHDPEGHKALKAQEKESRVVLPLMRTCILCGKEFEAIGSQTTCRGPHYKTCVVCGNQFEYKHASDKRKTCSRKCWSELRKITMKNKEAGK